MIYNTEQFFPGLTTLVKEVEELKSLRLSCETMIERIDKKIREFQVEWTKSQMDENGCLK